MKIKGYINKIDINRDMMDIFAINGVTQQIPGLTTARAEIVFTEGNLDGLINTMHSGEPIEIDIEEKDRGIKANGKSEWRMIRL